MFQSGDSVYLKDSAQVDIGGYAWSYVVNHRKAQIVSLFLQGSNVNLPESESLYIVVWPEKFDGGWDCWHGCMAGDNQRRGICAHYWWKCGGCHLGRFIEWRGKHHCD